MAIKVTFDHVDKAMHDRLCEALQGSPAYVANEILVGRSDPKANDLVLIIGNDNNHDIHFVVDENCTIHSIDEETLDMDAGMVHILDPEKDPEAFSLATYQLQNLRYVSKPDTERALTFMTADLVDWPSFISETLGVKTASVNCKTAHIGDSQKNGILNMLNIEMRKKGFVDTMQKVLVELYKYALAETSKCLSIYRDPLTIMGGVCIDIIPHGNPDEVTLFAVTISIDWMTTDENDHSEVVSTMSVTINLREDYEVNWKELEPDIQKLADGWTFEETGKVALLTNEVFSQSFVTHGAAKSNYGLPPLEK